MGQVKSNKIKDHQVYFCLAFVEIEVIGPVNMKLLVFGMIETSSCLLDCELFCYFFSLVQEQKRLCVSLSALLNSHNTLPVSFFLCSLTLCLMVIRVRIMSFPPL